MLSISNPKTKVLHFNNHEINKIMNSNLLSTFTNKARY